MKDPVIRLVLLIALTSVAFATDGTFLGTIVSPPGKEPAAQGWIFVQGRNRLVRRVDVTHATIVSLEKTSSEQGKKCGIECLAIGQEVRVTAEQDVVGEWRAKRVEILGAERGKIPKGAAVARSDRLAHPLTPANSSRDRSLDFARDFACGLPLSRYAGSLTPANGSNYKTLPWQNQGCWITTGSGLCIQPLTEKSIITQWSGV
jgi:hypothetical protein